MSNIVPHEHAAFLSGEKQAKIRGRIEHPHWEAPRYFLRPREKAQEIGKRTRGGGD